MVSAGTTYMPGDQKPAQHVDRTTDLPAHVHVKTASDTATASHICYYYGGHTVRL